MASWSRYTTSDKITNQLSLTWHLNANDQKHHGTTAHISNSSFLNWKFTNISNQCRLDTRNAQFDKNGTKKHPQNENDAARVYGIHLAIGNT